MRTILNVIVSIIVAAWIGGAAILSVQNFTAVSLRFLSLQTIEIPLGIVLAFSAGLGALGAAAIPLLLNAGRGFDEDG